MFRRVTLDNGVRIVYEKIPHVRSVSVGIWVGTGSRSENKKNNGVSHFIEHMMFKGTDKRSAKEIAESIDSIGGQINAFTGKECTCYYAKTLDTHLEIALDVLSDMFFNSTFSKKDIDIERKVVIEEIGMYEDSPEELVHDILSEASWGDNPLGFPILGTSDCLHSIERDTIQKYLKESYLPGNTVISVAVNFDDECLTALVNDRFANLKSEITEGITLERAEFTAGKSIREKDTEQVHICLGFEGIEQGNDDLYALLSINNIFGGGMSSRLFQKIREEMGLVYSIYSYPSSYKNSGLLTIYAGMNPEHLANVLKLVIKEIENLVKHGMSKDDLIKSKEQLKGNYILGLESTSSRMNSIGKSEVLLGEILSPEEVLKKIDNVSMEKVTEVIRRIFDTERMSFSAVGSIKKDINLSELI